MSRRLIAAFAAAFALSACAGDDPTPNANPTTAAPSASTTPTATATGGTPATPSASATPAGKMRVPVYYLGGTDDRPVLFREFRSVPKSTGVIRAAVDAMLHLAPADDDYYSAWPKATTVKGVSTSGKVATIDLSANARSVTASRAKEQASVQQLVYTVTAAAPSITSVRLRFDGAAAPTLWGKVDVSGTITRAAQMNTLAPIWVLEPSHNAGVRREFTVKGTATVFEATVTWAVTKPNSSEQLASGYVTATKGAPDRGEFTIEVELPSAVKGEIVFTAWESSAEDGRVTHPDSKTYRVS
jgi:spore germination protein GerM